MTLELIRGYTERGWRVIEIHRVSADGACTCHRGAACLNAGKHPVRGEWQNSPVPAELVESTWGPRGDAWGVGLLAGAPSGFWVLDVDPKNGGTEALAQLVATYGALPETHMHQTGSGGVHYFWRMPADGSDVTNAKGRLPLGLDVRGTGGQVVAPPSVSGVGPYRELTVGVALAEAPGWLYALIRPRPADATERGTLVLPAGSAQVDLAQLSEHERGRLQSYALAAVADDVARVAGALPGGRNNAAYAAACNLWELLNAGWTQLDAQAVSSSWYGAAQATGLEPAEIEQAWASAYRHIAGRARAMPGPGGAMLAGALPPFPGAPAATVADGSGWTTPGWTPAVPAQRGPSLRERLLTASQAKRLPPPEYLVDGWLVRDSIAWLIGASGVGKSFVSVSLACSVATGMPWYGRDAKQARVLYIVAEGASGIGSRIGAWEQEYHEGIDVPELFLVPEAIQARDALAWAELVQLAADDRYGFVIIDTQARSTVGMEENSATDMGIWVDAAERLRRASGSCVMIVHHEGHSSGRGRGSSALRGAAQSEITVTGDTSTRRIGLATTKQKDGPDGLKLQLMLRPPVLGGYGRPEPATSATVATADGNTVELIPPAELPGEHRPVVLVPWLPDGAALVGELEVSSAALVLAQIMASTFYEGVGGTKAEIRGVWRERVGPGPRQGGKGPHDSTFLRAFNTLCERGVVGMITGRGSFRWIPEDERDDATDWTKVPGDDGKATKVPVRRVSL